MTITAWLMDSNESIDQREPHKLEGGESEVSLKLLESLGVLYWTGLTGVDDALLAQIRSDRGYNYFDIITVAPDKLPDYENKIKSFYREHIHYDEEIRYCVEGTGYFDVRGRNNEWIRIAVEAGDMIILPEGIYHRFTCDATNYIKAMRLFVGEPIWTPYNREEIDEAKNASRLKYVAQFFNIASDVTEENDSTSEHKRKEGQIDTENSIESFSNKKVKSIDENDNDEK
eukprot:gene9704-13061_t